MAQFYNLAKFHNPYHLFWALQSCGMTTLADLPSYTEHTAPVGAKDPTLHNTQQGQGSFPWMWTQKAYNILCTKPVQRPENEEFLQLEEVTPC